MNASDIEALPGGVVSAFGDLESRIMSDIVRRIQINASITRSADWQITRLKQLGQSNQEIKKAIQDTLKLSDKAIDDIYAEAVKAEYIRSADLYTKTGNTMVSFADNAELQSLMDAVKKQTKDEFVNITQSLGFVTQEGGKLKALDITTFYQKTLDKAIGDISSGAFSYSESLRRTVKDMTNSGLRWIDYESGRHNRVTVAARRATVTGFNQTMSHLNEKTAKDLGTDSFEITWHAGARPDHQWFQGKVKTMKQLIEECGLGTPEGIKGPNCMHDYLAFVPGASVRTYTDAQLKQMNDAENVPKKYNGREYTTSEALQRQRQLETNMRAQRQEISLLKQGGGDPLDIQNAMSRYQGTSAEYTGLSKAMGLPQQRERVTIDGLGRITGKGTVAPVSAAIAKIEKPLFVSAKTLQEAEDYAKQFCKTSDISFKGVDIDIANKINESLNGRFAALEMQKLEKIQAVSQSSKLGKAVFKNGGMASYDTSYNGLYLNTNALKDAKTLDALIKQGDESWDYVMSKAGLLSGDDLKTVEKYIKAGRSLVDGKSVDGIITHELGHHIHVTSLAKSNRDLMIKVYESRGLYDINISGYACKNELEYVAESFSAYSSGEFGKIDPDLLKYFRGLEK